MKNEQIEELSDQAWSGTRKEYGSFFDDAGDVDFGFFAVYNQKFAELVWAEAYQAGFDEGRAEGFDAGCYAQAMGDAYCVE